MATYYDKNQYLMMLFKQRIVNYVFKHPDESKVSVAKRFGIANSTVHKQPYNIFLSSVVLYSSFSAISLS